MFLDVYDGTRAGELDALLIERFFRSPKEECVWQHNFESFTQASQEIKSWIRWYNRERPHQALGYQSPVQFRGERLLVA